MRVVSGVGRVLELCDSVDAFDARELARVPDTVRYALPRRLRTAMERLHAVVVALAWARAVRRAAQ